jgi:tetratricopeptide (TPR) repeat protein
MRALLAQADLARYAGQFVWLELSYDNSQNRAFFTKYGAQATPTFFIIDPRDERVAAMQTGAMSLAELTGFLERGENAVLAQKRTPADEALARGDALLAGQPANAADAYREALRLAPDAWPQRDLAMAALAQALQDSNQYRECAELAANEAAHMQRGPIFVRSVVAGMWCLASADPSAWSNKDFTRLQPLAEEALSSPETVRDHRDSIYRTLMLISVARNDNADAAKWGDRWLAELDAIKPRDDDERSAIDIARVENIQTFGDPDRILPALLADERILPHNYNASLRVAQMESAAKNYSAAVAACDRGLALSPGPDMRSWLLNVKAEALQEQGKPAEARRASQEGLQAAEAIPQESIRQRYLGIFRKQLGETTEKDPH